VTGPPSAEEVPRARPTTELKCLNQVAVTEGLRKKKLQVQGAEELRAKRSGLNFYSELRKNRTGEREKRGLGEKRLDDDGQGCAKKHGKTALVKK